jgi:hypothetical protein
MLLMALAPSYHSQPHYYSDTFYNRFTIIIRHSVFTLVLILSFPFKLPNLLYNNSIQYKFVCIHWFSFLSYTHNFDLRRNNTVIIQII